jgi:class 3 adenylate cyclase
MQRPPTRYARSGDARIAYQVIGSGPDLIVVGGPSSHLDLEWDEPMTARSLERLASTFRLIRFDRRGTGLSDPVDRAPTLEQQVDDLQAVMREVGVERTALLGAIDAGLCAMYAASYPEHVTALVLVGVAVSVSSWLTEERRQFLFDLIENHWGEGMLLPVVAPTMVGNPRFQEWWSRYERASASPSMARKVFELYMQVDLSGVLPAIRVPTLVIHLTNDALVPIEEGRAAARLIPGARFVEVPGGDIYGWLDSNQPANDIIEEFLTGRKPLREAQRVLSTVMFTDIVDSTRHAAALGDLKWRQVLDQHHVMVREELERWRGHEVKTIGDGFLATFDGPGRAVSCAQSIVGRVAALGVDVRAGLHTGECELLDGDIGGLAVSIGARVGALAEPGEVLVSSTVKDLVVGADLQFAERGTFDLKGVPGEWRLYRLVS